MKDKKTEFRYFTIADWEKEQEYLQNQHKKGWKFTGVSFPGLYRFEACEPEEVVYQLDYNPEGIAHKEEYVQMFRDCGWEYLMDFVGYSYFRKPVSAMDGEEEIFCDEASRLDMIKRVLQGRVVPLALVFLCIVWQMFMQFYREDYRLLSVFGALAALYLLLFLSFGFKFWKLWHK